MGRRTTLLGIAGVLVLASAVLHLAHYLIFRDAHHILLYLLGDVAFVPLEVLLVVIVIERLLHKHEKQAVMDKLNMVIGAFFSELGTRLLGDLTLAVSAKQEVKQQLAPQTTWGKNDFARANAFAQSFTQKLDPRALDLRALGDLLAARREFLLRLLENPNLLEHERFTDLLWAIFHLGEELGARASLEGLPQRDLDHLSGDLTRVYWQLARQWIAYAQHLQAEYPFLFSLLVRTHPLQEQASAVIT